MNICHKCRGCFDPVLYIEGKRVASKKQRKLCFVCHPYKPQNIKTLPAKCKNCNKDFYPVVYFNGLRKWSRDRIYCFECLPYKAKKGCSVLNRNTADETRQCRICEEYKNLSEFSPTNKLGNLNSYCKPCAAKKKKYPKQRFKEECIDYKGGCCIRCGYKKCPAALEFHHRDPSQKDFQISRMDSVTLTEIVKKELDKCDLLCSNCHKEEHYLEEGEVKWTKKQTSPRI